MQTLTLAGHAPFPARITRVGNPIFGAINTPNSTHTATVPLNRVIEVRNILEDAEGRRYRVLTVREILGKQRLELAQQ